MLMRSNEVGLPMGIYSLRPITLQRSVEHHLDN